MPQLNQYNTVLSPDDENNFQKWKSQYAPKDSGEDYDLRGAYKTGLKPDPTTGHWPDTFKKPNHPTFSVESQYAKDAPNKAGHWEGAKYIPNNGIAELSLNNPSNLDYQNQFRKLAPQEVTQQTPNPLDQFKQILSQVPQNSQYQPSVGRRIGSIFQGLQGGPQQQSAYLNAPYQRAYQDWARKTGAEEQSLTVPAQIQALQNKPLLDWAKEQELTARAGKETKEGQNVLSVDDREALANINHPKHVDTTANYMAAAAKQIETFENILKDPNTPDDLKKSTQRSLDAVTETIDKIRPSSTGAVTPYKDIKKEHPDWTPEQVLAEQTDITARPIPRVFQVNDALGNVSGYNVVTAKPNASPKVGYVGAGAGGAPVSATGIPPKPTGAVQSQIQRGQMLAEHVQPLIDEVTQLSEQLGPFEGRISDVLAGKVGTDVQGIPQLQEHLKLFTTALMQAHGLAGEGYEKHLEEHFNSAQTSGNLIQRIRGADDFIEGYAHGKGLGGGAPTGKTATLEDVQAYATANKMSLVQARKAFEKANYAIK